MFILYHPNLFDMVVDLCFHGASYCTSSDIVDYMISATSHGAVIGAWLGAWPMPLDWERPWQVKILIVTLTSML
jgi:hypothetical protein